MLLAKGLCHMPMGHAAAPNLYLCGERGPRAHDGLKSWVPLLGVQMKYMEVWDPSVGVRTVHVEVSDPPMGPGWHTWGLESHQRGSRLIAVVLEHLHP